MVLCQLLFSEFSINHYHLWINGIRKKTTNVWSLLSKPLFLSGMFSIFWKFVRQRCFADWQPDPDSGGSVVRFIFIFFCICILVLEHLYPNIYVFSFIQPARNIRKLIHPGLKGLSAESARAVTGRRCPHSGEREDFFDGSTKFLYENCGNSGTESRKIDPKVGN